MKRNRRFRIFPVTAILLLIFASLYLAWQVLIPHSSRLPAVVIEIPPGLGARAVVGMLREQDVLRSEFPVLAYLALSGNRSKLRAGEYLFDKPMSAREVVAKLVSGSVYLHKFTVPEGLTVAETAARWEDAGFGTRQEFEAAAAESVGLIRDLDERAASLEGYLYPETYSFPARTPPVTVVEAMVKRFRSVLDELKGQIPPESWPRSLRETVILASLIETEAAHDEERAVVSSVYLNRLRIGIALQCDPTVIYALKLDNRYRGQLTIGDLRYDSPYNTYRYPGLPPGAIANPGLRSLQAAVRPASTPYLYFVRTEAGRHTFSESLAEHNRAVSRYRALQRAAPRPPRPRP